MKTKKIKKEGIMCNHCYKELSKKEADKYSLQWQFSGDMYCNKCIIKYNLNKGRNSIHKVV